MKRIALFLAMILCLAPILGACGANSSPEKVATAAFEAMFIDCDYEAYFETNYTLDLDLLEEVMGDSDKYESMKDAARTSRDSIKESIKSIKDRYEDSDEIKDYDIEYDVRYVMSYEKDTDIFDELIDEFAYADTDFEDLVEEIAVVGIAAEFYSTDKDGNETVSGDYAEIICYNIDGDWYIDSVY